MEDILVSVIVPVYNSQQYIDRCFVSILSQKHKNIELIVVDDGSVDESGSICDKYAHKDKRVKVIHQNNQGVSKARNLGLDISKGDFIMFVDSDDEITENSVGILLRASLDTRADIVTGSDEHVLSTSEKGVRIHHRTGLPKIYNNVDHMRYFLNSSEMSAWARLYRANTLKDVRFNEELKINEDRLFIYHAFTKASKIAYIDDVAYRYHIIPGSASRSGFSASYFDMKTVADSIDSNVKEIYPELSSEATTGRTTSLLHLYSEMTLDDRALKVYPVKYNDLYSEIVSMPADMPYNNRTKNALIILKVSPFLFRLAVKSYKRVRTLRKRCKHLLGSRGRIRKIERNNK